MARSQAKVFVTIWSDPDWRGLSRDAQWLYQLLLSQGRLTLAGAIDLMPQRWAALAADTTVDVIDAALKDLEEAGFVAVDRVTDELVIRTFSRHDVAAGALNQNLVKGFWSAWAGVLSPTLRQIIVHNAPDVLWEKCPAAVPDTALRMRTSHRFEPPSDPPFEPSSEPQFEQESEPSATVSATVSATAATPVPTERRHLEHAARIADAARLLATAEARRRGPDITDPARYARSRTAPLRRQHEPAWRAHLDRHPDATADDLARLAQQHDPDRRPELPDADTVLADLRTVQAAPMPNHLRPRRNQ